MKNLSLLVLVLVLVAFGSCKKDNVNQTKAPKYAEAIAGSIIIQNGDVTLKAAPIPVTEKLYMYKGVSPSFTLVNGSEFLSGSAPALFWAASGNNPGTFLSTQTVYSNFTPAIQVRMIAKTLDGSNNPAYLGIFDILPTANSFPVTIYGKRLGDVLTLKTDDLTALPGYSNISFQVSYVKSMIDVDGTMMNSGATTAANWLTYTYSSDVPVNLQAVTGSGVQTVYDGLDAKITGTITITITVDGHPIVVTTPASALGHGLAITLKTDKKGWYDSGNMLLNHQDIIVDAVDVTVN